MATLTEQLDAMLTLKSNWDGYNADPIHPVAVSLGKEFVSLLLKLRGSDGVFVTPGRDGGVLVEWDDPTHEHEVEFNADGSVGFLRMEKETRAMHTERFETGPFAIPAGLLSAVSQLVPA
jgi:hypothetical protein